MTHLWPHSVASSEIPEPTAESKQKRVVTLADLVQIWPYLGNDIEAHAEEQHSLAYFTWALSSGKNRWLRRIFNYLQAPVKTRQWLLDIPIHEGCSSQTRTFNFTGIKRDASVAVVHGVVSGKCVLFTDRRHTCCGPVQRPLIKMADNSVSVCMEQCVMMSFVNNAIKPTGIFTGDFKHSTAMRRSDAVKHFNGVNISKIAVRPSVTIPAMMAPSPQQSFL